MCNKLRARLEDFKDGEDLWVGEVDSVTESLCGEEEAVCVL